MSSLQKEEGKRRQARYGWMSFNDGEGVKWITTAWHGTIRQGFDNTEWGFLGGFREVVRLTWCQDGQHRQV